MNKIREINRGFMFIEASIKKMEKEKISESDFDITRRELTYIVIINDQKGKFLSDIINSSGVTKATISNQIKLLIKKKFVYVEVDSHDLRKKRVWLTKLGDEVIKFHNKIRIQIKKEYTKVLSSKEIQTLITIGRKILNHIKEREGK